MSAHVKKIPFERQLWKPHLVLPSAAGAGAPRGARSVKKKKKKGK